MKETWTDEIEITQDAEHKTAVVNFINCGKIQVDPEKDVICDLCNNVISKFKDLSDKNIVQPETVDRAINNGLVEESKLYSSILKTLRSHEKKLFVENLKAFLLQSETPWALCDSCLKMVNGYDTQNKQKKKKKDKKYLTDDEAESLKAVCNDADEQAIIRDMLDTGMTLQEALNKRKCRKHLEI